MNIIALALIIMSILMLIVFFIYSKIQNKEDKKTTSNKSTENKKLEGTNKNKLKELIEIEQILPQGTIKLKGNRYRRIYTLSSPDFELLTESEQEAFENALLQFANSITFPIMFYSTTSKIEIGEPLENLKRSIEELADNNKMLANYSRLLYEELKKKSEERRTFVRKSYCIIGTKEINEKKAISQLNLIEQTIKSGLKIANIKVKKLNEVDILQLLAESLNKNMQTSLKDMINNGSLDYYVSGLGVIIYDENEEGQEADIRNTEEYARAEV